MPAKTYTGEAIDVTFDAARCLHAAECLRGLPEVFDTERRPWVLPDGAQAERVAEVVARCPTGALHAVRAPLDAEPHGPATVDAEPDAPLFARGDMRLRTPDGQLQETRAALCRCGTTANAPFCDASGPCTGWHD